jgi:hypothetical protein
MLLLPYRYCCYRTNIVATVQMLLLPYRYCCYRTDIVATVQILLLPYKRCCYRTQVCVSSSNANGEKIKLVHLKGPRRVREKYHSAIKHAKHKHRKSVYKIYSNNCTTLQRQYFTDMQHSFYMFRPTMAIYEVVVINGKNSYG